MSGHTPGPWTVERDGPNRRWLVNGDDFAVATCDGAIRRQEADARLIAAAPDLLNALRDMLDGTGDITAERVGRARAAIAKATGEAA